MTYADRSLGNLSDSKLSGWYRFSGGAGTQITEACPRMYSCSTNSSGWLSGGHPSVVEGIAQRKVCFSQRVSQSFYDCCNISKNISVRNCGAFYVYRLDPPDYYSRYCGNGLPQAPGKNELKMSSLLMSRVTFTVEMRKNSVFCGETKRTNFVDGQPAREGPGSLNVSKKQMFMTAVRKCINTIVQMRFLRVL